MMIRSVLALTTVFALGSTTARAEPPIVREQSTSSRMSAPTAPAPLQKYEVIIKNRTTSPVLTVTAKSVTMNNMSVNLLPNPIRVGRQGLVNLYDGKKSCEWVIRATMANGSFVSDTINACVLTTWTIN